MSDRPSAVQRGARAAAIAASLGLFAFVIVNAQFGCDAPATNAPPQDTKKSEPNANAEPQPAAEPKPDPDASAPTNAAAEPSPSAEPKPNELEANEPVFMPASKSGGDFGSMRFPGEQAQPVEVQPQQQNPAPNK